jgi:uncharacterized protein with LGFP repeats
MSATAFTIPTIVNGDPIQLKYKALGGAKGILGKATSAEMSTEFVSGAVLIGPQKTPYTGPLFEKFANGAIFFSKATGVHDLYGAIASKYFATAGMKDGSGTSVMKTLGLPTTDENKTTLLAGGLTAGFQGGLIDLMPSLRLPGYSPHVIYGAIFAEYSATNRMTDYFGKNVQKILGLPLSDETAVAGVAGGRMSMFQYGNIYWSPSTGAHAVYGTIAAKYKSAGGPAAFGLPIGDETDFAGVWGVRLMNFTGGNSITWSQAHGAHTMSSDIGGEFSRTSLETNYYGPTIQQVLGAPTTDEVNVPGIAGAHMVRFEGGEIFASPATGAHAVSGDIGALYDSLGASASYLGLPTSEEQTIPGGAESIFHDSQRLPDQRVSYFQNGKILWTAAGGAHDVPAVSQMDFDTGALTDIEDSPVDGWAHLTVYANGVYHFQGHTHDYGFDDYDSFMGITWQTDSGRVYGVFHQGHMAGTTDPGSRDDNWDVWGNTADCTNSPAAEPWSDMEGAKWVPYAGTVDSGNIGTSLF